MLPPLPLIQVHHNPFEKGYSTFLDIVNVKKLTDEDRLKLTALQILPRPISRKKLEINV